MKKILSIALALALCLTAMMGCFVVSAAANTLAVGTADITVGDATANVVVDITSEGVWAFRFDVKSDVALTAVAIDDANFNAELDGTKVLVQSIENDYANNITAAKITLTFATADLAAGSYAVAIENIDAGNYAEAAVAFDTTAGAIVVAEKVVEPSCEHANTTFVSAVPATDGVDGSITFTCDDCGETVVETVSYFMYYSFSADSASYASEIVYNFTARKDLLEYQGKYSDLFVYFEKESAESDARKEIVDVSKATERQLNGKAAYQFSIGIPAKELTDNVKAVVFVKVGDNWYNGMIKESTVATYCAKMMASNTTPEAEKKLIVDALHYGAAAQVNFRNYHIDCLATSVLTADQIDKYATTGTATADKDASNPFDATDKTDNVIVSKYSLSAESKVTINYTINTVYFQDAVEDLRAVFTYEGLDGNSEYVYVDVASAEQIEAGKYFTKGSSDIVYDLQFAELAAPDMRKDVTLTIYCGDRQVSCGTIYSIEAHVKAMRAKSTTPANELTLYNEMLQYGDSAAAYFG